MCDTEQRYVAVIGGAISGSVAAEMLADHGHRVVVFEQNKRPYGKIEDGLPRWHAEQRKQEYAKIDARMKKDGIVFVPCTSLGKEIDFQDVWKNWGFTAIVLANGAWRDRDLGVPGANDYLGKGLLYQNPLIYWYNHKNEKSYGGPRYETPDGAVVVGGGLASIDVAKVLQLENYEKALKARGVKTDMHEMEKKGIPAVCKANNIDPQSLGVQGCLLIYRRREQDMPLAQPPENATPEQMAKTESVRQKLLKLAREKFLFRFQERTVTQGVVVENGRLVGLKVAETKVEGKKADPIPGSERELRAPLVVSSIGSVPEIIPGLDMKGEYYTFTNEQEARYLPAKNVFGVGNVVTGQGNIRAALVHSQHISGKLISSYLGVGGCEEGVGSIYAVAESNASARAQDVTAEIEKLPPCSKEQIAAINRRIAALQTEAGYTGDYDTWIAKVTPPDLE